MLVTICDTDEVVCGIKYPQNQVNAYLQLEGMLKNEELGIVANCTPSSVHPDKVIAVVEHSIHVMTTKPMVTHWKDGVRMVKARDKAGVHLFVVKQNHRNSTLQLLKGNLIKSIRI